MAVFKIQKNNNYTVMSNYHLRDINLSCKAKGLLSLMLSLPEDWDYSMNGLTKICKEEIKAIRSMLQELEENYYLKRVRINATNGQFNYEYYIYEQPYSQKGHAVEEHALKDIQINTNRQIDKEDKTESSFFDAEKHNRLTLELIDKNYISKDDIQLYFYDNLFDNLLKDNRYIDLITIIHYVIRKLEVNDYKDENDNPISNKYGHLREAIMNNIAKFNNNDALWF